MQVSLMFVCLYDLSIASYIYFMEVRAKPIIDLSRLVQLDRELAGYELKKIINFSFAAKVNAEPSYISLIVWLKRIPGSVRGCWMKT